MEAKAPITVAITEEIIAINKVFLSADIRCGVLSEVKISAYDLKLKPLAKEKVPVLKKENSIISNMGAYSRDKISPRYPF
jgi:hypothetical protein